MASSTRVPKLDNKQSGDVNSEIKAFVKKMIAIFDAGRARMSDAEVEAADREAKPILGK
jgi:hypothetical protein